MKKIFYIILLSFITISVCLGQLNEKITFLKVIENLAESLNLQLSYSPDLVFLSDTTNFVFSINPDTCITQLENQADIRIVKTDTHLIISPTVPTYIQLGGKVMDAITGVLLPYTNILIERAGTGTITNTEGEFDFKILGRFSGSEVVFSFLGYENQKIKIPQSGKNDFVIKMQPKPYTLSDVYVLAKGSQPVDIVKRAAKNIKRNYHRSTIQMEAFYRNINFRNDTAAQLIEAAVLIEDKGIDHSPKSTKIEIEEIRKSSNYLIPEKLKQRILEKFWGHKNIIHRCYDKNIVRNYKSDWWFGPLINFNDFKYEFVGFVWLDSIKVYKIKYIWNALLPDGKRRLEHENVIETGGCFYISTVDHGILKAEWLGGASFLNYGENNIQSNFETSIRQVVGYQKINDKYYLKFVSGFTSPNGNPVEFEDSNAPREKLKTKRAQWAEEIMLVTRITTNRKEFDRIKYREKLKPNENSYKIGYPYNAEFWNNYSVLKKNPVEERLIKEMEWEKTLELQFEENSLRNAEN